MSLPKHIRVKANNKHYEITLLNSEVINNLIKKTGHKPAVNIFASGPSIADVEFTKDLLSTPSIFVNGSISLTKQHDFKNIVGYVVSDKRFIKHNPEVLAQFYNGQPLFATQAVYEAIALRLPDLIKWYHQYMSVIFPANRPLQQDAELSWIKSIPVVNKLTRYNKPLPELVEHRSFVIYAEYKPSPIGVSLNMTDGFIEAGTVAYVAAQLAYTLQFESIHLYGIDLINSHEPRFYENEDDFAPCKLDKAVSDRIVPSFNLMVNEYDRHGVKVINHSPVSKGLFGFI